MSYKLIALDLDDTLLNDSLIISEENVQALNFAHSKGVKIVISTGRSITSCKKYIEKLDLYGSDDYFISFNGAIISNRNGDVLFEESLDQKYLESLIKIGREYEIAVQLYDHTKLYAENYSVEVKNYERRTSIQATIVENLLSVKSSIKLLYNSNNVNRLEEIKSKIIELYKAELNVFYSKPTYLEVLSNKADKGLALKHLAETLNIPQNEIIAVGDSYNDISMLKYAGVGVCVQNAKNDVKMQANYITQNTNNDHAIAEVVYKYI